MNKLLEIALSRVVAPIIVLIIGPSIVSFVSKVKTNNWTAYFSEIPAIIKVLFVVFIVVLCNISLNRQFLL